MMMKLLGQRRAIRAVLVVAIAFLAAIAWPGRSHADVAVIETTVPLEDSSEASVEAAVHVALDFALREAMARGFQWFRPLSAFLGTNYVGVQILATSGPIDREEASEEALTDRGPGMPAPVTTKYDL
jgi:hypothetical protein